MGWWRKCTYPQATSLLMWTSTWAAGLHLVLHIVWRTFQFGLLMNMLSGQGLC